jgi:hypothetical protein
MIKFSIANQIAKSGRKSMAVFGNYQSPQMEDCGVSMQTRTFILDQECMEIGSKSKESWLIFVLKKMS